MLAYMLSDMTQTVTRFRFQRSTDHDHDHGEDDSKVLEKMEKMLWGLF